MHVGRCSPWDNRGLGQGVDARGLAYLAGFDAADGRDSFGRVVCSPGCEFLETDGLRFHELSVVKAFFDDDVDPGENERRIGAVVDPEVVMGELGGFGCARATLRMRD